MASESSVESYLETTSKPIKELLRFAHNILVKYECFAYVKTIYIGYDFDGVMVGALYRRGDHLEIALALPENYVHPLLIDAGHLTWRTLPVAALLYEVDELQEFEILVSTAVNRVKQRQHDVNRGNEYFAKRQSELRGQSNIRKSQKGN